MTSMTFPDKNIKRFQLMRKDLSVFSERFPDGDNCPLKTENRQLYGV